MGRKAGGADIYGYRTNADGEYTPDPEEAKVVRLIFESVVKDYSLRQVKAELMRRGLKSKWGRESWSIAVLGAMLRNDIYLGVYRFHKSKHGKDADGSRMLVRRQDQIVAGSREKPNHPPLIEPGMFDVVQQKFDANRMKNSVRLHMATGLLRCRACEAHVNIKYSTGPKGSVEKYVCSKTVGCMKRLNVAETNDALWRSLVQLFVDPERIHALATPSQKDDLCAMKKELADTERDEKGRKEKQERLLNLYLEGNIPQASYVVKSSELERETGRMHDRRVDLQRRIQGHGKSDVTTELIQTLRLLARSHRRFTEEQKTKVFRSIVKEARLTEAGVELVLYAQPTQNGWWKYRQKVPLKRTSPGQTVRVGIPLVRPSNQTFTVGQAAKLLGISADNLRWRIKVGKYPDAPKENGRRVFTREQVQKLEALG